MWSRGLSHTSVIVFSVYCNHGQRSRRARGAASPSAAHRWQITDSQGRVQRIDLRDTGQPDLPRVVTQVDLQAFGGARAVYKLIYNDSTDDQSTTGTPVALMGCGGSENSAVWFLTKVVLPDGSRL